MIELTHTELQHMLTTREYAVWQKVRAAYETGEINLEYINTHIFTMKTALMIMEAGEKA